MKYFSIKNELINLDNVLKISLKKDKEHMGDLDLYQITFTFTNGMEDKHDILLSLILLILDFLILIDLNLAFLISPIIASSIK